jgi:Asp-tRNA(Asn)/Glu-tRNA(Gln) amidotransferase A subunit family amidase
MPSLAEYEAHDALGLAELVAKGETTASELVEMAIAQVEELNPLLNAVVVKHYERARRRAASGPGSGPFGGVPFLTKDLAGVEGDVVSFGSVFFRNFRSPVTDEYQLRLERAGLISIGRTNSPEFGLLPTTEPVLHGPAHNPWALGRSTGGSSGGAAAATAAGIVPMAHASDGGGSIRIPASACGVFGMKPSRGRMPRYPESPADYLSVELAVSRSVRDLAVLLDATHGAVPGAAYHAPPPELSFASAVEEEPAPMRIAVASTDFRGKAADTDCREAVVVTSTALADLGHKVEEAGPVIDGQSMAEAFLVVWESLAESIFTTILAEAGRRRGGAVLKRLVGDWGAMKLIAWIDKRKSGRDAFESFTWDLAKRSRKRTPAGLEAAKLELQRVSYQLGEFFEAYDSLLSPVLGAPPVALGELDQDAEWEDLIEQLFDYVAYTPLANFTGVPAMSVPTYWAASGLPIGTHFIGPFGDERRMFALAGQLERALPWFDKRPVIR